MKTGFSIKGIIKYSFIILTIISIGKMCYKEDIKPPQEVWGSKIDGTEVNGKVQNIGGVWKGVILDNDMNKFRIVNMQKTSDGTFFAYDTNGDLFTLHF